MQRAVKARSAMERQDGVGRQRKSKLGIGAAGSQARGVEGTDDVWKAEAGK